MSLISDPDFLIHSIRLGYLRNVDDPYGSRLISLDPSYRSNAYVVNAGMADADRWPELSMTSSPVPSDDEAAPPSQGGRPSGFPGATGLKYTTTIMGPSRTGALGLRVSGKRASTSAPRASLRRSLSDKGPQDLIANGRKPGDPDATPTIPSSASPRKRDAQQRFLVNGSPNQRSPTDGKAPIPIVTITQGSTTPSPAPSPAPGPPAPAANGPIPFVPRFKGAAEMEARRQLRMRNRMAPGGARLPAKVLNPEFSSSSSSSSSPSPLASDAEDEANEAPAEEDDEFDDDMADVIEDIEDVFDPEFAGSRGTILDSASDGLSLLSDSQSLGMSISSYSVPRSSLVPVGSTRGNGRLSPVRETHPGDESFTMLNNHGQTGGPSNIEKYFEMVTPPPLEKGQDATAAKSPGRLNIPVAPQASYAPTSSPSASMFAKRPIPRVVPGKSALTAMLAQSGNETSENPFTELYSAISARSDSDSTTVRLFFPHAEKPAGRAMNLKVRKDATMEEVLGFALCTYWEEGWQPRIDKDLEGEEDPRWSTTCSALGWVLRIAEDDGEVDEDFPPPDRTGKISKFNFPAYAVLEATPSQVQQNKIIESKIQRRLSRIVLKKKKSTELLKAANREPGGLAVPLDPSLATSATFGSTLVSSLGMFPSSLGPSNSGPPQFLRIRIADTADAGHVSTTIQASGGMYMAEVLEAVCQKRKLPNPKDYALVLDIRDPQGGPETKIYIPVDRTVRSLQGKRDLMLIKKTMLHNYGVDMGKRGMERSTDPNASILKRGSEVPEQVVSSLFDISGQYKRYTVYRKVPMLVTRSARLLAIDGGYIHIMPQANKAKNVFESSKTLNYDINSVVACQQSSKNSATFKLVVVRGGGGGEGKEGEKERRNKRYEFEAENAQLAAEIVATIRGLKTKMGLDRANTVKQSRRSKQVS